MRRMRDTGTQLERTAEGITELGELAAKPRLRGQWKDVERGKRGGLFYRTDTGYPVYLNPDNCRKCLRGELQLVNSGCPPEGGKVRCHPKSRWTKRRLAKEITELRRKLYDDPLDETNRLKLVERVAELENAKE